MSAITAPRCLALDPSTPIKDFLVNTWTMKERLPQNQVWALSPSRQGYLWLGTDAGVVRFDGDSFTILNSENTPGLPNLRALALLEDRKGRLWVGLENGLTVIENGRASAIALGKGTAEDTVLTLQEDRNGIVWAFATSGDLYGIGNGRVQERYGPKDLGGAGKSFTADSLGALWLPVNSGITRIEKGRLSHYPILEGGLPVPAMATFEDRDHVRWAVTRTSLFTFRDGAFRKMLQYSTRSPRVNAAEVDAQGTIWIGTNQGVYRVHGSKVDIFDASSGLANDVVTAILPEPEGGLWISSYGGLNHLRRNHFETFPADAAHGGKSVWSVVDEPGDGIWLATTGGAIHIKGNATRTWTVNDGLASNYVYCVHRDHTGAVWIGTDRGLSRWKDGQIRTFSEAEGVPNVNIMAVYETRGGRLLVSVGNRGLAQFDGARFHPLPSAPHRVWSMNEDNRGDLLISAWGSGLYRWNENKLKDDMPEQIGAAGAAYIASMPDADGTVWAIDEAAGLVRIRNGSVIPLKETGSPFRSLTNVMDAAGNFWIPSSLGLLRVSKKEINDYLDGRSKEVFGARFTVADGLPTDDCNGGPQNTMWKGLDGRLWFATPRGAVAFNPREIALDPTPPPTLIESIVADGRSLPAKMPAHLPADVMRLDFQYTGIDFQTPQQVRFRYRMENFDNGWMDAGTRRMAFYMNLPAGSYRFRVQARSRDGVWNEAGASFVFAIAPHYYRTWWFYLLCAVFTACTAASVHLMRMAQMRRAMETAMQFRVEERSRIARELHDTLLQGIAGIAMQLRALMQRLPDGEARRQLGEALTRMEHSTRETRLALRDLRVPGETVRNLRSTLEAFGLTIVADSDQKFTMEIRGDAMPLPSELSQDLLRFGQEAILNAARHSEATEIRVMLAFESSAITLAISDDGKGFDPGGDAGAGHWGLVGMRERAHRMAGEMEISSRPGGGTRVEIKVPQPSAAIRSSESQL